VAHLRKLETIFPAKINNRTVGFTYSGVKLHVKLDLNKLLKQLILIGMFQRFNTVHYEHGQKMSVRRSELIYKVQRLYVNLFDTDKLGSLTFYPTFNTYSE